LVKDLKIVAERVRLSATKCFDTVDRFQGQEAPVVIYSMATSSPEDAPRGMEFLYSLNRLNVAISGAKRAAILVANPWLFDRDSQRRGTCNSPMQSAGTLNSFGQ
jgi:superfamily I DNA and/or RNA helicase